MKQRGISMKVPPSGSLINNNAALRNMCCARGPKIPWLPGSYKEVSILIPSCTIKSFWSSFWNSNIFIPTGFSRLPGSNKITSSMRSGGTFDKIVSTASPCGSIKQKPRPSHISWYARFVKSTDLPIPVAPITYVWRRRSFSLKRIVFFSPRNSLTPRIIPSSTNFAGPSTCFVAWRSTWLVGIAFCAGKWKILAISTLFKIMSLCSCGNMRII